MAKAAFFNPSVAAEADAVIDTAVHQLLTGPLVIETSRGRHLVVVVSAPAGAGKSYFVCTVAKAAVEAHPGENGVIVIATPTNDQAHSLLRALHERMPKVTKAFVPAGSRPLPPEVAGLSSIVEITSADAHHFPIVVGTLDKLGNAHARGDLAGGFRYLCIDEAYQAHSAQYYGVGHLADRHVLVGDPGQLDPFTTMEDADRWRGLPEDPTQTAVAVVLRNHPQIQPLRLPVTRRLPVGALPFARAFYPGHAFDAWTVEGARRMRLTPVPARGDARQLDQALDNAAESGWAYLRLPHSPVLTADPATIDTIVGLAGRLERRTPEVFSERTNGKWTTLSPGRVAVAVSHNDQKDHLRAALDRAGHPEIRVDTANKLQGLEFDVLVAWHPLAGLPGPDGFHLDPGRLCVMLTRHRHACIVIGRAGDADLIDIVPPVSDAWIGYDPDPEVDGWFVHRLIFDQLQRHAVDL